SSARAARTVNTGSPCSVIYPQHQKCDLYHKLPRQNIRHCNLLFPLAPLSCLSVHRSPLGILPFLAVLSVEPENMSTYVIVEEPGDWPCHADYLLTARTYLQHGLPTTGGRPRIINLCRSLEH